MAVTFPPNPNVGDTVTDTVTGAVWVWNGTAWVPQGSSAGTFLPTAGGTMTGPIVMSGAGSNITLPGNVTQPLQAPPLQQVMALDGNNIGRNYIHNAQFNINQRGATSYTQTPPWMVYCPDRWAMILGNTGDSGTLNWLEVSDGGRATIGDESAEMFAQVQNFVGGSGATNVVMFVQRIEDVYRLANKTCMLSFWAYAGTAGLRVGVSWGQDFGAGGSPSAAVSANAAVVTLSTLWVRYTVPITFPSVAGMVLGTTPNTSYSQISFWLSCPPANTASYPISGNLGAQSGSASFWGVQLELGSSATPLEHRDPELDLALCQRFFLATFFSIGTYNEGGQNSAYVQPFPVVMRAGPTLVPSNTSIFNGTPILQSNNTGMSVGVAVTTQAVAWYNGDVIASADL